MQPADELIVTEAKTWQKLQKALKQSAEQAQRMAAAFGVTVPYAKT